MQHKLFNLEVMATIIKIDDVGVGSCSESSTSIELGLFIQSIARATTPDGSFGRVGSF